MNRLKVAVAILLIIPALLAVEQLYLNKTVDSLTAQLDSTMQAAKAGNTQAALKSLSKFDTEWQHCKPILSTFIRHSEVDLATQSEAKLEAYLIDKSSQSNFFAECDTLRMQLNHIAQTEKFSFDNIL